MTHRCLTAAAGVAIAMLLTGFGANDPYRDALANVTNAQNGMRPVPVSGAGVSGKNITFELRFRAPAKESALAVLNDGAAKLPLFALSLKTIDGGLQLEFTLRTDRSEIPLHVGVPILSIGADRWHDVVARYSGPKLDLFVDGVLVDEEWPMGTVRSSGEATLELGAPGYQGVIIRGALWKRKLSDLEVASLSGSTEAEIAARTVQYFGAPSNQLQYWKPQGWNTSAGDAMPMYENGTFHVYYLFDRRHHQSKWGLGAHQWAHVSSTDLIHWQHHPMALPITDESEGSICTGSVFHNRGQFYAFYATRKADRSEQLGMALSNDGIHFEKSLPTQFREPENPYKRGPNRDPFVFLDHASGLFKMLVTAELLNPPVANRGGALELLESADLKQWSVRPPFFVPGYAGHQPECSDFFEWNGWNYLLFGQNGATHYRMSRSANGPWLIPSADVLDDPQARVMKTAAFGNHRRIGVAFVAQKGFGGNLVFRELIQNADGTLGTKFPAEMTPRSEDPGAWHATPLTNSTVNGNRIDIQASEGFGAAAVEQIPTDARISLVLTPSGATKAFGAVIRGAGNYESGVELRLEPARQRAEWRAVSAPTLADNSLATIDGVAGLDRAVTLEIVAKGDIFDVCINGQRTAIHRTEMSAGNRLFLFAFGGKVSVEKLEVRKLRR